MKADTSVLLTPEQLRKKTRRSFLIGGAAAALGVTGYTVLRRQLDPTGIPIPERRVLDANGRLWESAVSSHRLMPEYRPADVQTIKVNGDFGLSDDPDDWSLDVVTNAGPDLSLLIRDVQSLPPVSMITRFCCIEGWSVVCQWKGVRFRDFTRKYFPQSSALPRYVSITTPDEDYYVGLDTASAMHPQTLLAWELNGQPLTPEHGAPLRLVIPVKYGVKNIKRVGSIEYTDERPSDYWAEEGYDWFAGL